MHQLGPNRSSLACAGWLTVNITPFRRSTYTNTRRMRLGLKITAVSTMARWQTACLVWRSSIPYRANGKDTGSEDL